MAYTVTFREFLKEAKRVRELALLRATAANEEDHRWGRAGPELHVAQAPSRCGAARSQGRCSGNVLDLVERGAAGEFQDGYVPPEVELGADLFVRSGNMTRSPKLMDLEDLQWDELPGDEVRQRRELDEARLLDDMDPESLFNRNNEKGVTVEQLLEMINDGAGEDSRCTFMPCDACCWLDRMHRSGHVRFRIKLECYGVVERPTAKSFPKHRVMWPEEGHPTYRTCIADWEQVVVGGHQPRITPGSTIWKFFIGLGFRLGFSIGALERWKSDRECMAVAAQLVSLRDLRRSIAKWQYECNTESADGNQIKNLAELVRQLDIENMAEDYTRVLVGNQTGGDDAQRTQNTVQQTQKNALALIRTKIIDEISENKTMLALGREHRFYDYCDGREKVTLVRDMNWDWAATSTRGRRM
ncbi:hypothetical protein B0H66DRAFT_539106 [Apodospora peruviana]|uniref:Uncharacterized protein n=1 Tax=Apodospora peruviana TaxID=516989 RepID=A0AAE0HSH5_9PEZI|nr:hypothetical protein B0H66DRAFT_539106 [Apodospora peruviana]